MHESSTKTHRGQKETDVVGWIARVWSLAAIAMILLLCLGPLFSWTTRLSGSGFLGSPYALVFAAALILAWHRETLGGSIALGIAVICTAWAIIEWKHFVLTTLDLLVWPPPLLFLIARFFHGSQSESPAPVPVVDAAASAQFKRRFFALPSTRLGWWSLGITAFFFVFMRLFWLQAFLPGRNRSTFFSDPLNAFCLIGAFASPLAGTILALIAAVWKRERSLFLVPVVLMGLISLMWTLAALFGNP